MKWTLIGGVALLSCLLTTQAQNNDPNAPTELVPKLPTKKPAPGKLPDQPALNELQDVPGEPVIIPNLHGLIIVQTEVEIKKEGAPDVTGLKVTDIPLLSGADFQALMAPYFGRPVRFTTIKRMETNIILYCRAKNHPLVDVILPEQDLTKNAVLQLLFLEGTVEHDLTVTNKGKAWFKKELLLGQVRLKKGDHVDSKELRADLDWLNRNPFRQVDALFKQGQLSGRSDVVLQVQDRLPLRVYGGYEDTGTRFTGRDRLLAGFNWGNAFGVDHQLNYQYTTDTEFRFVKAHSVSYLAPLPWRHTLTLFGSYVDGRADFGSGLTAEGKSYQGSLRYSAPLPAIEKYQHEVSAGFDFKRANNALLFGGTTPPGKVDSDINQFELGYSALIPDKWGQTSAGLEGYYSPGGLLGNNNDTDFMALRSGTSASYWYTRLNAERITRLPYDFSWIIRAQGQLADHKLLPSEELGLGGHATVRGYDERLVNGDNGWIISNELRTPSLRLGNLLGTSDGADFLQFLAFFDYGATRNRFPRSQDIPPEADLASVGGGLRFTVSQNLALRLDYGYQLSDRSVSIAAGARTSRAHVSVLLSY